MSQFDLLEPLVFEEIGSKCRMRSRITNHLSRGISNNNYRWDPETSFDSL